MKNKIMILLTTLSLGLIVSCALTNGNNKPLSQEDLTMTQTILSVNMLNNNSLQKMKNLKKVQESSTLNQDVADKIFSKLDIVDSALDYSPVDIKEVESDKQEYGKKIEATLSDLDSNSVTYTLYYNYSLTHEEDDEGEVERTYSLNGVAYVDNLEYQINGTYEEEIEGDKKEQESEIKVAIDNSNFVMISQELENSETEYSFEVIKDGVMIQELELEIEEKNNFISISIEEERNGEEFEIEFYKTKSNNLVIDVKVEIGRKILRGKIRYIEDATNGDYYELKFDGDSSTYKHLI